MSKSQISKDEPIFFNKDDLIFIKEVSDVSTIEVGDVITFVSYNTESKGKTVSHKVRSIKTSANGSILGFETYGRWKLALDARMNEIMPYYNKLYESELLEFNPLYTTDLTRKKDNTIDNDSNGTVESENHSTSESSGTGEGENHNKSVDKFSETPQGALTNVENGTYLTNARITEDDASSSSSTSNSSTTDGSGSVSSESKSLTTEDYLEHVVGFDGRSGSKLLKEYRETFLNIDMMVIEELEPLFMQLW